MIEFVLLILRKIAHSTKKPFSNPKQCLDLVKSASFGFHEIKSKDRRISQKLFEKCKGIALFPFL